MNEVTRKQRQPRGLAKPPLDDKTRDFLLYGKPPLIAWYTDEAGLREKWTEHREALTATFRGLKKNAGKVPFGWWEWEAPERRLIVGGSTEIIVEDMWDEVLPGGRGEPRYYTCDPEEHDDPPVFEPGGDYLARLGVLE